MQRFNKFHSLLAVHLPKFKVTYKSESSFMKFLNIFLGVFNKSFMTDFITTIGYTVYFPTPTFLKESEFRAITLLAHEYVHAVDAKRRNPILYSLLYIMPIPLFIITLCFGFLWWPLFLISLVFLLPLPAPYRTWAEIRGYTMTLFILNEIYKERGTDREVRKIQLYESVTEINRNFTGFAYYLMWPFGKRAKLEEKTDKIVSGDILKEDAIYGQVQLAFAESRN